MAALPGWLQLMPCAVSDHTPSLLPAFPCSVSVKKDDFFYVVVSGSGPTDKGAFTLTIDNALAAT